MDSFKTDYLVDISASKEPHLNHEKDEENEDNDIDDFTFHQLEMINNPENVNLVSFSHDDAISALD